jgi:hypothetical protein
MRVNRRPVLVIAGCAILPYTEYSIPVTRRVIDMRNPYLIALAVAVACAATCQAGPVAILSNLPGTGSYNGNGVALSTTQWYVAGLQMGSAPMLFDALTGYFVNQGVVTGTISGGIYSDASGVPGALYAAFVSQTLSPGPTSPLTFVTSSPSVILQPNTDYWFLLDDAGGVLWLSDSSNSFTGTAPTTSCGGCSFLGYQQTPNGGGSWSVLSGLHPTLQVTADAAPEPGSASLLLICGALAVVMRRRTSRRH